MEEIPKEWMTRGTKTPGDMFKETDNFTFLEGRPGLLFSPSPLDLRLKRKNTRFSQFFKLGLCSHGFGLVGRNPRSGLGGLLDLLRSRCGGAITGLGLGLELPRILGCHRSEERR